MISDKVGDIDCSPFIRPFFWRPIPEQMESFHSYDLKTQYALYVCGNHAIHPPATWLGPEFAKSGEPGAKLLKTKLAATTHDVTIRDIAVVIEEMARTGSYDVAGDSELLEALERKAGEMNDPGWKQTVEEMVVGIKNDGAGSHP